MNEIAKAIYDQFGGNRAMAMIGGTAVYGEKSLTVHFKGCKHTNCVDIKLDDDDTYTVKFFKIRGFDVEELGVRTGIHGEYLADIFEYTTGLRTYL